MAASGAAGDAAAARSRRTTSSGAAARADSAQLTSTEPRPPRDRRRRREDRRSADSSEDLEREDDDDEEDTQTLGDDEMTQGLLAGATESPPPFHPQSRSPPTSPPTSPLARTAGTNRSIVSAASMSPADVETTPGSGEDDDSRSETSTEMNAASSSLSLGRRRSKPRKHVAVGCSDHEDLASRLQRAVRNADDGVDFDESLIGADVVLCVRSDSNNRQSDAAERGDVTDAVVSPSPPTVPVHGDTNGGSNSIQRFHAHRFMLAASSAPFRAMLTGPMRESSQREVEICDLDAAVVHKMLLFIYTGDVVLTLEDVLGLLLAAEMYELLALREMCRTFALKHAHEVFCAPQLVQLPEKLLLELIPQDELQIRELALMDALVQWGEARVDSADSTSLGNLLADVMEHVRFPTMSVSDLYGKVRPLVRSGVIREHLLTEALFNHLKWGSQTGLAAKRARPRALTASLRKRKRVSFIQHVSFEPTT